jgi:hypothetical protein
MQAEENILFSLLPTVHGPAIVIRIDLIVDFHIDS